MGGTAPRGVSSFLEPEPVSQGPPPSVPLPVRHAPVQRKCREDSTREAVPASPASRKKQPGRDCAGGVPLGKPGSMGTLRLAADSEGCCLPLLEGWQKEVKCSQK